MTNNETQKALHYEARMMGHAEARTLARERAAQALVKAGQFELAGTIGGATLRNNERARWYRLAPAHAAELRRQGFEVVIGRGGAPVIAPDVAVNQAADKPAADKPAADKPAADKSAPLPMAAFAMIADATATDESDEPTMFVKTDVPTGCVARTVRATTSATSTVAR